MICIFNLYFKKKYYFNFHKIIYVKIDYTFLFNHISGYYARNEREIILKQNFIAFSRLYFI